jgi:phage terminase small subunit
MTQKNKIPNHLTKKSRTWAASVLEEYDLTASQIELLLMAAEQRDQSEAARAHVAASGAMVQDRFGVEKESPWCKLQRDSALSCSRLMREIGLSVDADDSNRPPALEGR